MRNSRFLACFVASAAINVGVISVVGRSRLLSHETPTVEEVLNPIPLNSYKPRPLNAAPAPTPTPLPQMAGASGGAKTGVKVPPLRRVSAPAISNSSLAANAKNAGTQGTGEGSGANRSGTASGQEGAATNSSGTGESGAAQGAPGSGDDSSGRSNGGEGPEAGNTRSGDSSTARRTADRSTSPAPGASVRRTSSGTQRASLSKRSTTSSAGAGGLQAVLNTTDSATASPDTTRKAEGAEKHAGAKRGTKATSRTKSELAATSPSAARGGETVASATRTIAKTEAKAGDPAPTRSAAAQIATAQNGSTGTATGGSGSGKPGTSTRLAFGPKRADGSAKAKAGGQGKAGANKASVKTASYKDSKAGKQGAAGSSVGEDSLDSPADENAELIPASTDTAPPKPLAAVGAPSKLVLKMWNAAPNQKIVLPDKLNLELLKDLTDLPVGNVTLTDAQREQIRKMLEGQKLTQIKGLDRALLKKLVDASKQAERASEDKAEDFDLTADEKKARKPRAGAPRGNRAKTAVKPREKFASLPEGLTSPFRYRPWSPAFNQRYQRMVKKAETDNRFASIKSLVDAGILPPDAATEIQSTPQHDNTGQNNSTAAVDATSPAGVTTPGLPANNTTNPERNNASANGTLLTVPGAEGAVAPLGGNVAASDPLASGAIGDTPATNGASTRNDRAPGNAAPANGQPTGEMPRTGTQPAGAQGADAQTGGTQAAGSQPADGRTGQGNSVLGGNSSASNDERNTANAPTGVLSGGNPGAGARPANNAASRNGATGNGVLGGNANPSANDGPVQSNTAAQPNGVTGQNGSSQQGAGNNDNTGILIGPGGQNGNNPGVLTGPGGQGAGQPGTGVIGKGQQNNTGGQNGVLTGPGGGQNGVLTGPRGPQNNNNGGQNNGNGGQNNGSQAGGNQGILTSPGGVGGGRSGNGQPSNGQPGNGQPASGLVSNGQLGGQAGGRSGGQNGSGSLAGGGSPTGNGGNLGTVGGTGTGSGSGSGGGAAGGGGGFSGGSAYGGDFASEGGDAASYGDEAGEIDMGGMLEGEDVGSDITVEEGLKESRDLLDAKGINILTNGGAPTSVGVAPNLPPHNYSEQKGLAGALVLPPLPPLGTASGKNPQPRAVKPVSRPASPTKEPAPAAAQPQAMPKRERATDAVARAVPPKEAETREAQTPMRRMVQRLFRKPVEPQSPQRQAAPEPATAPLALPFGSPSERGTVYLAPAPKSAQLPPGSATDRLESAPVPVGKTSTTRSGGEKAAVVAPAPVPARQGVVRRLASKAGELRNRRERSRIEGSLEEARPGKSGATQAVREVKGEQEGIAERKGAVKAVAAQAAATPAENTQSAQEKKASNSRGVKEGSLNPLPPTPLPDSDAELGDGSGLKGEYYLGRDFEQYEFTRADKNLDLFWGGESSPSPKLPIGADWSCRWTGKIMPRYSETYTIFATADDGVRVWIDHKLIIDGWGLHGVLEYSADVKFEANKQYNIRVDYFESGGPPAAIGLYWESPTQKKEFVPQDRLFYPLAGSKRELEKDEKP